MIVYLQVLCKYNTILCTVHVLLQCVVTCSVCGIIASVPGLLCRCMRVQCLRIDCYISLVFYVIQPSLLCLPSLLSPSSFLELLYVYFKPSLSTLSIMPSYWFMLWLPSGLVCLLHIPITYLPNLIYVTIQSAMPKQPSKCPIYNLPCQPSKFQQHQISTL